MKIISFIDQPGVIKAILQHGGLWKKESRPPPKKIRHWLNGRGVLKNSLLRFT